MPPDVDFVVRLAVAAVLGSLIGLDRERLQWAAGLRTHMLVCVGACLAMIVSAYGFNDVLVTQRIVLDPSRVAAQVVSGVGFLGAGSIILRNEVVKGLTTAASLWTVAAIGLAVGCGLYAPAVAGTVIVLIILAGLKPIEARFKPKRHAAEIALSAPRGLMSVGLLEETLGRHAANVTQLIVRPGDAADRDEVSITLGSAPPRVVDEAMAALSRAPGLTDVQLVRMVR
ncbi:MgtC/SapB family protein [Phenylobacterium sp.]|uniref:MgtC/SapB family protein n=1 Tax=Phenylobacterium sp. TaxID=1871053 RepID=UPI0012190F11|nr:MgtC/SapB family protein [Phenylobacterium sp.]THD59883.1 MAG: MgtC/SapB family protein [Phenylobacterium sp.]